MAWAGSPGLDFNQGKERRTAGVKAARKRIVELDALGEHGVTQRLAWDQRQALIGTVVLWWEGQRDRNPRHTLEPTHAKREVAGGRIDGRQRLDGGIVCEALKCDGVHARRRDRNKRVARQQWL